ncbi:hypothetical protein CEXT_157871 [Caerostris extrusa]|uniref:Uncharacterized protein n=1 Tax=Caerostris extrusa TaxID=172846 RepID=A0AAV4XSG3_CAEEX|nr:hypothetical protein CEXT_157871 [Caerostris extrusa]
MSNQFHVLSFEVPFEFRIGGGSKRPGKKCQGWKSLRQEGGQHLGRPLMFLYRTRFLVGEKRIELRIVPTGPQRNSSQQTKQRKRGGEEVDQKEIEGLINPSPSHQGNR